VFGSLRRKIIYKAWHARIVLLLFLFPIFSPVPFWPTIFPRIFLPSLIFLRSSDLGNLSTDIVHHKVGVLQPIKPKDKDSTSGEIVIRIVVETGPVQQQKKNLSENIDRWEFME
jgi:hypothetical protein